jgi:hypothetical protein
MAKGGNTIGQPLAKEVRDSAEGYFTKVLPMEVNPTKLRL